MAVNVTVSGATTNTVSIERKQNGYLALVEPKQTGYLTLTVAGPQGPAFAGEQYFDTALIGQLSVANSGVTVKWNGNQFVPASELAGGLTIYGGAF